MRTSAKGRAFIERHEGVVLKAYRDIVGVWTIGAGLTAASGVVVPRAGMTITAEEASVLLHQALLRNYEPAVVEAMARMAAVDQHEFDAAVSFQFNTGAIGRASWVTAWLSGDMARAVAALRLWNKARGRVVTGLVRRRDEEARLLRVGDYGGGTPERPAVGATHAAIAAPLTAAEVPALRAALIQLGYGGEPRAEYLDLTAVRAFQAAHDLTVDGIVGRATASAIRRALDARAKGGLVLAATGGSGAAAVAIDVPDLAGIPGIEAFPALAAALWGARLAFAYRDVIAPAFDKPLPRVAAFLRSF